MKLIYATKTPHCVTEYSHIYVRKKQQDIYAQRKKAGLLSERDERKGKERRAKQLNSHAFLTLYALYFFFSRRPQWTKLSHFSVAEWLMHERIVEVVHKSNLSG